MTIAGAGTRRAEKTVDPDDSLPHVDGQTPSSITANEYGNSAYYDGLPGSLPPYLTNGYDRCKITSKVEKILAGLDCGFVSESRPDLADLVHWRGAESLPIHRWFRYREGYSPDLITRLHLGQRLLDPFCGCGSIIVGAAQIETLSVGIDVNPLAIFVARVKLTPLAERQIASVRDFADSFEANAGKLSPWPLPGLSIVSKVFEPVILDTLMRLRAAIEYASLDVQVRDFLLLAWLSVLEEVGSYFKEGNGIKYRNRKRLKSGYIPREEGVWQAERFGNDQAAFVIRAFSRQLATMIADTAAWKSGRWREQRVYEGDALTMDEILRGERFDSIIFSPPYANRFDYFESMKVELWFGGFVRTYDDLGSLRKRSLRSHLGADLVRPNIKIQTLEELIALMDSDASSWRMGVPSALRGYFSDMFDTLKHCKQHLTHGKCHIVVGNSAFAGVIIPTDTLIAQLGLEAGFSSARLMTVRHLTVAPQQRSLLRGLERYMRETVVVLE